MHFVALISSLSFLVASASAAAVRRNDPHRLDFRTFGAAGCNAQNQGVYTLLQSDNALCKQFLVDLTIGSAYLTDLDPGCSLTYYTDTACALTYGSLTAVQGVCSNGSNTTGLWKSYKMVCPDNTPRHPHKGY